MRGGIFAFLLVLAFWQVTANSAYLAENRPDMPPSHRAFIEDREISDKDIIQPPAPGMFYRANGMDEDYPINEDYGHSIIPEPEETDNRHLEASTNVGEFLKQHLLVALIILSLGVVAILNHFISVFRNRY